jgi:flagellar motor switch protein FliM
MSQILSQEEVDVLLKGVSEGDIETEQEGIPDASAIQAYDLTIQDRGGIREKMPSLVMINENFARMFRATLSSLLKKIVDVNILSMDMAKYGEFIKAIPVPASLHVFKMDPLRGNLVFIVESQVIFTLVDIMFGGSGRKVFKIEGRNFTSIENNLIKRVILSALSDLKKAWKPVMDLDVVYLKSEVSHQLFAQIMIPTDIAVIVRFEIDMEFSSGIMTLCIPYTILEPIKRKLQINYQNELLGSDKEWATGVEENLKLSKLNLTVELGRTELTGKEIINLKVGNIIPLDHYCDDVLDVYVEDVLKFRGESGIYKGNQAIKILEFIT